MHNKVILLSLSLLALSCADSSKASSSPGQPDSVSATSESSTVMENDQPQPKSIGKQVVDPSKANAGGSDPVAGPRALLEAYPDFISSVEDNKVNFRDGTSLTYDDGRIKDFDTLLDDGDVEDMFFVRYDAGVTPPEYLHDAGRSRSEALFKKMYGNSAGAVKSKLVKVPWFGKTVEFTPVNGAADSLRKVAAEIAKYPELRKYLDSSGTFYWRPVRGAKRQSAHSYGIAFDIAVPYSDYWLWKNKNAKETSKIVYANKFPQQIVEIFERHGFIWGGAWYHYDTMHFEFRPEILAYSRLTR